MNWKFLGCTLVVTVLGGLVTACSDSGKDPSSEVEQTGSMRLPLETTAASGNVYRLRYAQFVTWGPQTTVVAPPEDATSFTTSLAAGIYSVELWPGWQLWRMGPEETQVEAELISPNPVQASIQPDTETVLTFQFRAGNDVIVLGPGELTVDISVVETACASDADCAPSEICQASVCVPNGSCGNGMIDPSEECDDFNNMSGDGCAANCTVEYCSDGVVQFGLGEECDDGNLFNGDGCSVNCQLEQICGDGVVSVPEQCDDGNVVNGDGCSAVCMPEFCADGVLQPWLGEECDDGNVVNGDGCSASCQIEIICGDGVVDGAEQCDDGNNLNGDGCSATCLVESLCGDGVVEFPEVCDDGNTVNGDGCNSTCNAVEPGFSCPIPGNVCSQCGNGVVELAEVCDDGNMVSGDGCRADCQVIEAGWVCPVPGNACNQP